MENAWVFFLEVALGLFTLVWMIGVYLHLVRISKHLKHLDTLATQHSPELTQLHYIASKMDRPAAPQFPPVD